MQEFIINIFIYTFSIFGMIMFFLEIFNDMKFKNNNNKIIIIFDNDQDFEDIYRRVLNISKKNGTVSNIYILNNNNNNIEVINKLTRNNNISIINDKEELLKVVNK